MAAPVREHQTRFSMRLPAEFDMDTMLPVILIGRRALAIIGIAKRSQRFEVQAVEELNEAQMRLLLGSGALVVREVEELDPLHSDPMMCELEILIKEAFTT